MSKVALVIGLASTLSFPAFAEDQMLEGTSRLVSSTRKLLETGQVVDTLVSIRLVISITVKMAAFSS
jgi:hypothetical protein